MLNKFTFQLSMMFSKCIHICLVFTLIIIDRQLVEGSRRHIDKQTTTNTNCEKFKTDEICKLCKKKDNKYCINRGKKHEMVKPFSFAGSNYQQKISLKEPESGFCYFNITHIGNGESNPERQDRLFLNETGSLQSCSELGNWSVTKECDLFGDCQDYNKQDYDINYIKGMASSQYVLTSIFD